MMVHAIYFASAARACAPKHQPTDARQGRGGAMRRLEPVLESRLCQLGALVTAVLHSGHAFTQGHSPLSR
jgi:hypothetical protein